MTDNDIIKALEDAKKYKFVPDEFFIDKTLDLINRQQAEVKRLEQENFDRSLTIETWKWEAVKDFAERLKEKLHLNGAVIGSNCAIVNDVDIDNLVKEMVGEN